MRRIALGVAVALLVAVHPGPVVAAERATPPRDEVRVGAELLGGLLGYGVGIGTAVVVGPFFFLFLGLLGPLGVYLGGELAGGDGGYLGPFLLSLLGWGATIGVEASWEEISSPRPAEDAVGYALFFSFPLSASMLGYEWSNDAD